MIQAGIHPEKATARTRLHRVAGAAMRCGCTRTLEKVAVLFVPAFNVEGHERSGRWNRPIRTARSSGLAYDGSEPEPQPDTPRRRPEMQALLRLINDWDPLACADLHVTDGRTRAGRSISGERSIRETEPYQIGRHLRDSLIEQLAAEGSLPLPFYPDLARIDDPASGFVLSVYSPRFSTGYMPARNRLTLLVETHS